MKKTWEVNVNGTVHKIEYTAGFGTKIIVNGQKYKVKSQNWFLNMIDYPIQIDGEELRVVAIGKNVDLAVNGVYVGSGENYTPLNKVPGIANVFIGISCIGGLVLCGWLGMLVGILFSSLYAKKGLEGNKKALIGSFIGCTAIQLAWFVVAVFLQVAAAMI